MAPEGREEVRHVFQEVTAELFELGVGCRFVREHRTGIAVLPERERLRNPSRPL